MTDLFDAPPIQRATPSRSTRSAASKRAAAKRRRRRRQRTTVILALVVVALGGVVYVLWDKMGPSLLDFSFTNQAEDYPGPGVDPVEVVIPEGATGSQMGVVLHEAGVVASVQAFSEAFAANPDAPGIQPGTYQLLTEMKAADAVAQLVENDKIQMNVTIPEGYTVDQVIERVASVTSIPIEELEAALAEPKSIGLPKSADGNAEGWLFPKTYSVQPGDDATTVLSRMVAQTKAELESLGVPKKQWQETLITASIVEKEAPDGYRGEVARVIENRLAKGSPLGMDAIDAYGRGKPADQITKDEFNDSSFPYASRKQIGLPPTPISNPGAKSVEAVIDPPQGNWMWYVTVNLDTGETKFTDDYNEFLVFRSEYQAWVAENS